MAVRDVYYPLIITFLVLDCIVVALRVYTRLTTNSLGGDDALIVTAVVGFILFGAMEMQAVHYGIGAAVMEPAFDLMKASMYFTIAQILYILSSGITKLAVAVVLLRLTKHADMHVARFILIGIIIIVVIFTFATTIIFALQCRPLSVAWGVGTGTCISTSAIGKAALALSVQDVVSSWFCAFLPVYMLWKTAIPLKVKITTIVLLGLGALSSVATIIRLKYVVVIQHMQGNASLSSNDLITTTLEATIYSILEIALSILAASMAALRPLLRKIRFFSDLTSGGKSKSRTADSYALRTFGQSTSRNAAGAIKLDDGCADDESQRGIMVTPQQVPESRKEASVEVHGDL